MINKDDYILRISGATQAELVVISFDIMLDSLDEAGRCHKVNPEEYIVNINRARDALMELIGALDPDNPVAAELRPLYIQINTLLLWALLYEKKDKLLEASRLLSILREGWEKAVESQPQGGKLYKNAPKVYAGLTYGKNGPEDYIENQSDRGIKA